MSPEALCEWGMNVEPGECEVAISIPVKKAKAASRGDHREHREGKDPGIWNVKPGTLALGQLKYED